MDGPKVSGPPTLPARFTRFFGREAEIDEVEGLTARARLLTLTGAPGCGKTRLGIEVADRLKENFADGADRHATDVAGRPGVRLPPPAGVG